MNIPKELVDKIVQGNCVVFVGAGLSQGAGLPSWSTLLRQMLEWSKAHNVDMTDQRELENYIEKGDLLDVAEEMRNRLDKDDFRKFMAEIFRKPNLKPTDNHMLLPKIPFTAALTSNYDTLVESAYTLAYQGVSPPVITHADCPELSAAIRDPVFYVFKVHGTIDRIETVILGRKDYRKVMLDNPEYHQHLTTLFSTKTVLFLGFGLTDPDLLQLLDELRVTFRGYTGKHYALINTLDVPRIKQKWFERDYGIHILPYTPSAPDHPEVKIFLTGLLSQVYQVENEMDMDFPTKTAKVCNKNKNLWVQSNKGSILPANQIINLIHVFLLPIQSIVAKAANLYTELSQEKDDLREQAKDIKEEAIKLGIMVENMRSVLMSSHKKEIYYNYEMKNIKKVLEENIEIFRNEAFRKNIEIKEPVSLEGPFPDLPMSYHQLRRAFFNLIQNAVKFSYFSLENKNRYIEIIGKNQTLYYIIEITNHGLGILYEELKDGKIFEDGYRGVLSRDRERTGAGVGLSEAKKIIENHGGSISVSSLLLGDNKLNGIYKTTVCVTLPKFR